MPLAVCSKEPEIVRRINIVQGEHCVSADPAVVFSTLLGSCVSACMRDPIRGVGGLNHFLLPGGEDSHSGASVRLGVHAMELLVNSLLRSGARKENLEAKLFGGANLMRGLTDVGALNSTFAEGFLKSEGIKNLGGSLRGTNGRRIQFWPVTGRARQFLVRADSDPAFDVEPAASVRPTSGALELF